jgi:hypothetical protein
MKFVIVYRHQGRDEFLELIKDAINSVKKLGYKTVLVGTKVEGDYDEYIPTENIEPNLALWILYARQCYLESPIFDCNTVFIDPDVLVIRPVDELFEQDFDMAVTERDGPEKINMGVQYVKPHAKEKLIAFYEDMRARARQYPFNKQRWFGDQKALNELLVEFNDTPCGLKVLRVPCDLWNASPSMEKTPEKQERNKRISENAKILHFKGHRKQMMKEVWSAILP